MMRGHSKCSDPQIQVQAAAVLCHLAVCELHDDSPWGSSQAFTMHIVQAGALEPLRGLIQTLDDEAMVATCLATLDTLMRVLTPNSRRAYAEPPCNDAAPGRPRASKLRRRHSRLASGAARARIENWSPTFSCVASTTSASEGAALHCDSLR